jgi:hypothetical protein
MIVRIPGQRKFKTNAGRPFNDLVTYLEAQKEPGQERLQERSSLFDDILNYTTDAVDKSSYAHKCIAMRTSCVNGLVTASLEMNAVAKKNTRCTDPAYHFILSWPEHETPAFDAIFDAAQHALHALNLREHQYVLAIHGNTDNMHCHICVNRVHPVTYKARHIEWAFKTLHRAARESEIKHGWSHDNGLYVVEIDAHGNKQIVPRIGPSDALAQGHHQVHPELGSEAMLPAWHDPDSLESWLKTKVARDLKPDLGELTGWPALHAWLSDYNITLSDSGGGGMRLHSTSPDTGEILDLAASKGLRQLKRDVLEKRWGPFANGIDVGCVVPDLSHLTPKQLAKGVHDFLARAPQSVRPPAHIIAARQGVETDGDADPASTRVGETQSDIPRPKSVNRDDLQRAQRKERRALARAELRLRFASHKRLVGNGDTDYFKGIKALQSEQRSALKRIREQQKAAQLAVPMDYELNLRLMCMVEIDAESLRRELEVKADFQKKSEALRVKRTPPLSWRAWLYEQSSLGDQAALSALRGIVYQAQRDAKKSISKGDWELDDELFSAQEPQAQFSQIMARLLEEEKKETAIRSAKRGQMRPYQADALLAQCEGMQWRVTGNGNVEYRNQAGAHLFTDRGNRVTFDRELVSDDEIRLALVHAQHKFGAPLTLTGEDVLFTARMARLASDMDIAILNPEMQSVIAEHRLAQDARRVLSQPVESVQGGTTTVSAPVIAVNTDIAAREIKETALKLRTPEAKESVLTQNIQQIPTGKMTVVPAPSMPIRNFDAQPVVPRVPVTQNMTQRVEVTTEAPSASKSKPEPSVETNPIEHHPEVPMLHVDKPPSVIAPSEDGAGAAQGTPQQLPEDQKTVTEQEVLRLFEAQQRQDIEQQITDAKKKLASYSSLQSVEPRFATQEDYESLLAGGQILGSNESFVVVRKGNEVITFEMAALSPEVGYDGIAEGHQRFAVGNSFEIKGSTSGGVRILLKEKREEMMLNKKDQGKSRWER